MRKLVIIGNGFDLHAGLASSFNDFFTKSELPAVEKWISNSNTETLKETSFVSLLLYNTYYRKTETYRDFNLQYHETRFNEKYQETFGLRKNLVDWMDVEGFLYSFLTSKGIGNVISIFNTCFMRQYNPNALSICNNDDLPHFISSCLNGKGYFSVKTFYDFFFEELQVFEKRFVNYLKKELEENKEYSEKSDSIIKSLAENGSGIILNFNYTYTYFMGSDAMNVHGSLDDSVIIGIDGKEKLRNEIIPFTKTFRKLIRTEEQIVLDGKYDEIIIYGHSLGKQDYSYFQSIFDYIVLYSSKTKITFYYSDDFIKEDTLGINKDKSYHKIEMAKKLFDLIKSYGETLDNKDNGQNLIHKLLLEGRLKIVLNNF